MLTYEEYIKQTKAYTDALELIKQDLAQHRSDMALAVKETVADLEPKIPALQEKINTLIAEISRLEGLAVTTSKKSEYDKNYWNTQYLNLREGLEKTHQERMEALDIRQTAQDNRDALYQSQVADLQAREQKLKDDKDNLKSNSDLLVNLHENFQKEKVTHADKVNEIMASLEKHHVEAKFKNNEADIINSNLIKQSEELVKATKEAEIVIARIGEAQIKLDAAQKILDAAYAKEQDIKSKSEALEISIQEIVTKNITLANRSTRLDQQEARLHQRTRHICSLEEQRQITEGEKNARPTS